MFLRALKIILRMNAINSETGNSFNMVLFYSKMNFFGHGLCLK